MFHSCPLYSDGRARLFLDATCEKNLKGLFHLAPVNFAPVLHRPITASVVEHVRRTSKFCFVVRTMNDRCFDELSLGVVGIIAFFFFLFSHHLPASAVAEVIGHKPLHCVNKSDAEALIGSSFRFVEVSPSIPVGRQRGSYNFPIASVIKGLGVRHCAKHGYDTFVCPKDVSAAALYHAAAELFFLRRMAFL